MGFEENFELIAKAWEAGNYNAAPSTLVQGAATQKEDLSTVMYLTTYEDKSIKLQKDLKVEPCKSLTFQFNRKLSYGILGGSAVWEGQVGQEQTSDVVRTIVPMAFYSELRRVTVQATMVDQFDGSQPQDVAAKDAALRLAGDIELDCFRGQADFSNLGVFDGNPYAVPALPNMHGLDLQVRQSDNQKQTKDLMLGSFGADQSVVIAVGGTLGQGNIEDAAVRSQMNHGQADILYTDPLAMAAYNKLSYNWQRLMLAGSPQTKSGSDLKVQWTSSGPITLESSRWLAGRTAPDPAKSGGPNAPSISAASATVGGTVTTFVLGQVYNYVATSVNEVGESAKSAASAVTIAANGDVVNVTITHPGAGTFKYFRMYRTAAGGAAATAKYIGSVVAAGLGAATTTFRDLNNKAPAFTTGFLVQKDTMGLRQLAPFTRFKQMAINDLSFPEAFYRFCGLAVYEPRKNVLLDNLFS